jgi:hypothetical protein
MTKKAISLTLSKANLLWLRAETAARRNRSVSETLDRLLDEIRARDGRAPVAKRSVVGMVRIDEADPNLEKADEMLRTLFSQSLKKAPRPKRRKA